MITFSISLTDEQIKTVFDDPAEEIRDAISAADLALTDGELLHRFISAFGDELDEVDWEVELTGVDLSALDSTQTGFLTSHAA